MGAFNANNMEMVQAIVETATEENAPVILQVSQGAIRYAGLDFAANMVKTAAALTHVPVVLHLDHGTDFEQNVLCLRAGFTSLMYDGSAKSYEQNVAETRRIVEIAHIAGIPVEGELGQVPKAEKKPTAEQVRALMTDPDQARRFVEETGVDSLAVAIGSIHAMAEQDAGLEIDLLARIHQATMIPLVLHGSSGVTDDSLVAAIENGIVKINVATFLSQAFIRGMREALAARPNEVDPRKILAPARDEVKEAVRGKIRMFRSNGRITKRGSFAGPSRVFRSAELGEVE